MTLALPFSIDDTVYFLDDNQVMTGVIRHIHTNTGPLDGFPNATTWVEVGVTTMRDRLAACRLVNGASVRDQKVFLTKAELLASL